MKSNNLWLLILISALVIGCSVGSSGGGSPTPKAPLVSLAITPPDPQVAAGIPVQFTATGTFSNNTTQNITASVIWNSTNPAVATISNASGMRGLAVTAATGTTTISASSGTFSSSTSLAVTPAQLALIAVAPATSSISTGSTQQYTASGSYSNNFMQNVTASVTWISSAPDVATISNTTGSNGLATSAAAGTTMIKAVSGSAPGAAMLTVTGASPAFADNVLPITVNGSLCTNTYINKPCVGVTICTPNTSNCQTINDILLDTGSFGLRIFKQALPPTITPVQITSGSGLLAECVQFGDGSSLWGPVQTADIILGSEPAVQIPIQVVDSTFGTAPTACQGASASGFNGILGIGVFSHDCGTACTSSAIGIYYSCSGSTCNAAKVPLTSQVQNPVVSLPTDSNGVIVQIQSVPPSGAPSAGGILVLGIGTRTNNMPPAGVTSYKTGQFGEVRTVLNGNAYNSIIDSGSNGLFFTPPSSGLLPNCASPNSAWFCPTPAVLLSATNEGALGTSPTEVFFQIGNLTSLASSSNRVFSNIGGAIPNLSNLFDWGLPFYFGRSIYIGIDGKSSSLDTGPYFAY